MNLIILGPQGSGKGTQAKALSAYFGLYYHDMGAFLRNLAKANPKINQYLLSGNLIPDEMFADAIKILLRDQMAINKGIILDGFPRTFGQYQILIKWLEELGEKIDKVIYLQIADNEVQKRLSGRRICSKCGQIYNLVTSPKPQNPAVCDRCGGKLAQREDDKPQAIKKRLELFKKETMPILDLAEQKGILIKVDAMRPIDKITRDIIQKLKQ